MTIPSETIMLGIETSCDETAAAVVTAGRRILSNVVFSQIEEHKAFGGVVPEIAARAHLERIGGITRAALDDAGVELSELSGIAATGGPGLIGGVMVGVMTAKALALASGVPFIPVNHLEGHALTARLTHGVDFPYLLLLVSGGHCQLLAVDGVGTYRRLGTTMDDAVGEAFDKTAKLLDLGFPGGPALERAAMNGDPARFALPSPMLGKPGCDFSFSGLKTAVRRRLEVEGTLDEQARADLAAAFQNAVTRSLVDRSAHAMEVFSADRAANRPFVVAGGVAANQTIRAALSELAAHNGMTFHAPPLALCTDNGAMIAWAGLEHLESVKQERLDTLGFAPRPRWPLDPGV